MPAAWYESQRAGLSIEFIHALDRVFDDIAARPTAYRVVRGSVRRALLCRFPYGVFFVETDDSVIILAVVHARRHPRVWPSGPRR